MYCLTLYSAFSPKPIIVQYPFPTYADAESYGQQMVRTTESIASYRVSKA